MCQLGILGSILLCGFLARTKPVQAENLKLVVTNSRLPVGSSRHAAVYDGDDTIYLVGGYTTATNLDHITKYSLSTGVVGVIGRFKTVNSGTAIMDNADIIHFGGNNPNGTHFSDIDRISTVNGTSVRVNSLPIGAAGIDAVWNRHGGVAYLLGGSSANGDAAFLRTILRFNASDNRITQVGQLPGARGYAATAWVPEFEMAYVFGSSVQSSSLSRDILTFNPATGSATKLSTLLPWQMQGPKAAYMEHSGEVVIMDGQGGGLVSFDPVSQLVQRKRVEGWPNFTGPSCIYVPSLARIYIFGGYGSYNSGESSRYLDEISYISFVGEKPTSTTEPSTTEHVTVLPPPTTEASICPPFGVHNFPYPGNCTLYIRCFDGDETVLSCAPLLFDKIDLVCKPPSEAVCDAEIPIQCPPTGYETHSHPTSCTKYFECNNGNAYESECAPSTYFDTTPDLMHCNLAHLAVCNAECPPNGIALIPIRARDCKWYKVCVDGNSANLECWSGEVYSPIESKCVPSDEYMCPYAGIMEDGD